MKSCLRAALLILFVYSFISCSKSNGDQSLFEKQYATGDWYINRIQLKYYSGGNFVRDSILPYIPVPKNYLSLTTDGGFAFQFNTSTPETGTYQFTGTDSLIATVTGKTYRWKMLTVIKTLFTAMSTYVNPSNPGSTVETYYTFVR
jgi:hypothetical protein